jgi:hypothetical protein
MEIRLRTDREAQFCKESEARNDCCSRFDYLKQQSNRYSAVGGQQDSNIDVTYPIIKTIVVKSGCCECCEEAVLYHNNEK